jgi:hypothetical protein
VVTIDQGGHLDLGRAGQGGLGDWRRGEDWATWQEGKARRCDAMHAVASARVAHARRTAAYALARSGCGSVPGQSPSPWGMTGREKREGGQVRSGTGTGGGEVSCGSEEMVRLAG